METGWGDVHCTIRTPSPPVSADVIKGKNKNSRKKKRVKFVKKNSRDQGEIQVKLVKYMQRDKNKANKGV
jgi:hypothetical protein